MEGGPDVNVPRHGDLGLDRGYWILLWQPIRGHGTPAWCKLLHHQKSCW